MQSLTDNELANFLTHGILVQLKNYITVPYVINLSDIKGSYTDSKEGLKTWLAAPQEYQIVNGDF